MTKKQMLEDLLIRIDERIAAIDAKFDKQILQVKMKRACDVFELIRFKENIKHELWIGRILQLCRTGK
jgi:hypothetical protein